MLDGKMRILRLLKAFGYLLQRFSVGKRKILQTPEESEHWVWKHLWFWATFFF